MTATPHIPHRADRPAFHRAATGALLALLLGLAACKPAPVVPPEAPRDTTVGQKADAAAATAQSRAEQATANAKQAASELRADTSQAMDKAGSALKDAAITTAVTAKLAADPTLKALRINVDTAAGRVALSGDAPDNAARDRATTLARSVDGVTAVNNQLTIKGKG